MTFESILLSLISFLMASFLIYFGFRSLIIHKSQIEDFFIHLNISWLILGVLWIVIGLLELIFTINSFSPFDIIKILVFFGLLFLLEFSLFYLTLFSNRTLFFEFYLPIIIGFAFGLNLGSIFISNNLYDFTVLIVLIIVSFLVFLEFLIMQSRFRKITKLNKSEKKISTFFSKITIVTLLIFLASSADVFIFLAIFFNISLISLASVIVFVFLLSISLLITIENRYIFQIIKELDLTLILNEIN